MAEVAKSSPVAGTFAYLGLMLGLVLLRLLPMDTAPSKWPLPDLMVVLSCVYAARRPRYMPIGAVAAVFVLADFLLMRTPGVLSLCVVLATEFLRRQSALLRAGTLTVEWLTVGLTLIALYTAERVLTMVLFVPRPDFVPVFVAAILAALSYPLVAGVAGLVFGLQRQAAGTLDNRGRRL